MGNTISGTQKEASVYKSYILSREILKREVFNDLKKLINPLDMIQLSRNLPFEKGDKVSSEVTKDQLFEVLHIKRHSFLWKFLKLLANWPVYSSEIKDTGNISLRELITCLILLTDGLETIDIKIDLKKIAWMAMIDDITFSDADVDVIANNNGKIQWNLLPIVQSLDEMDLKPIRKQKFKEMIIEMLPLLSKTDGELTNWELYNEDFKHPINSMAGAYYGQKEELHYEEFVELFELITPRLFEPLKTLLSPLTQIKLIETEVPVNGDKKILTPAIFSQLNSIRYLDKEIMTLFTGSQMGFSIRSLQSHIFKYRAPTLMLIRGKVQPNFDKYKSNFFRTFPNIRHEDAFISTHCKSIVLGVYVDEPWQVTNTKTFCNGRCEVYELHPNHSVNKKLLGGAYFTTIGLGVGVGSNETPLLPKVNMGEGVKFGEKPGGSITIDNSLEMGNFRRHDNEDVWFKIIEIEVYGLGGLEIRLEQQRQWEWEKREAERRRYIGDIEEGRALLELAGIIGQSGQSGGSI